MTTMHDLTPTYDDMCHYADVGRRLTQAAGIALDTHPDAATVLQALTRWTTQAYAAAITDMQIALSDLAKANKDTRPNGNDSQAVPVLREDADDKDSVRSGALRQSSL